MRRTAAIRAAAGLLMGAMLATGAPAAARKDAPRVVKPAYFASISAARARMRTGPGRKFPATWLYVRPDLPVRVIDSFDDWRKVEDPDGTQGWVLGTLLGRTRTAIVTANEPVELRDRPAGSRVLWRAAPGVVGRVSACANGWCRFDVHGQAGFTSTAGLWGVAPDETLP